jgi:hypothetical protein
MEERWETKHLSRMLFHPSPRLSTEPIAIEQQQSTMRHGTTVWDSSKVMLKYLERQGLGKSRDALVKDRRCIELGSGCGLLGVGLMCMGPSEVCLHLLFSYCFVGFLLWCHFLIAISLVGFLLWCHFLISISLVGLL